MPNDTSDNKDRVYKGRLDLCMSVLVLTYIEGSFIYYSDYIKIKLFKSYCSSVYGSSLWCNFSKSAFNRLKVAWQFTGNIKGKTKDGAVLHRCLFYVTL